MTAVGNKRKAKAVFEIILFTFVFTVFSKTGMMSGKERRRGVGGEGCSQSGSRAVN